MPESQIRVGGSGFTTLVYAGKPIAWLEGFADSGQAPQGQGFEAITPLDSRHPKEIVTGRVLGAGTITTSIRETWNAPVWWQLSGLEGTETIVDVWERLADQSELVTMQMTIKPPGGRPRRGKVYHNCVVTSIDDGENITVAGLSIARNIVVAYTHVTALRQAVAV